MYIYELINKSITHDFIIINIYIFHICKKFNNMMKDTKHQHYLQKKTNNVKVI